MIWTEDDSFANEDEMFVCGTVDRKDSSKGYEPSNVVPACTMCNMAKRHTPYDVFIDWIERVYQHQRERRT